MESNIIAIIAAIYGAILGSFSTALIHRLHFDESGIVNGRSRCPNCKKTLTWKNLIPIFSWIFQKGRCACCHKPISPFYPLIEISFASTFFIFAHKFYDTPLFFPLLIAAFFLLVLFYYDLMYMEVDQRIVFPAIILAALWTFFRETQNLQELWIGGLLGYGFYASQYYLSGKKWVGGGDLYFGALLGLLLGWKYLLLCLFLAYIIGATVAIYLIIFQKYKSKSEVPMGAFLMPSGLLFLYMGSDIWNWYWQNLILI